MQLIYKVGSGYFIDDESSPVVPPELYIGDSLLTYYRRMWDELHRYRLRGSEEGKRWLADWESRLPPNCSCKADLQDIKKRLAEKHPEPFASQEAYFTYTVALHNEVNRKLGKPIMALETARQLYKISD